MIPLILILLVVLALTFTLISFAPDSIVDFQAKMTSILFGSFSWFSAALGGGVLTESYSHLFENAADNSYTVVTGTQQLPSEPGVCWLFLGLGIMLALYGWYYLFRQVKDKT